MNFLSAYSDDEDSVIETSPVETSNRLAPVASSADEVSDSDSSDNENNNSEDIDENTIYPEEEEEEDNLNSDSYIAPLESESIESFASRNKIPISHQVWLFNYYI